MHEIAYGIAINPISGNVSIVGSFSGNLDVSPGPLNVIISSTSGSEDIFVATYNASGVNQSNLKLGGTGSDAGFGIAIDSASNMYLSGRFQNTVDFDLTAANSNTTSNGSYDAFVVKYSNSFALQFINQFGGQGSWDISYALAIDPAGNVYTTGNFSGTADADPGSGTQNVYTSNGGTANGYVMKYTPAGALAWIYRAASGNESALMTVALDAAGNVYTTGNVAGTFDADNTAAAYLINQGGSQSTVLVKLSNSGSLVWATAQTCSNFGLGHAVATDASGNVIVAGRFIGDADVDASPLVRTMTSASSDYDCFVTHYANCNFPAAPVVASENVCAGQSISLSANGTGTISWYSTATGNTYALPNGTNLTPGASISYFAQDSNQCGSGPRSEKAIIFYLPPVVQATASPGVLCAGAATTISATGASAYLWNTLAITADIQLTPGLADTAYQVIGTEPSGCADTAYVLLQVNPVPQPVLSTGTDTICQGASISIYDTNPLLQNSYQWSTGAGTDTLSVTPAGSAVYTVSVESAQGCTATASAAVELSTTDASVTQNGAQLTAVATDVSYQWVDCGTQTPINGATNASFTPAGSGQYQLLATNARGCTMSSACFAVTLSSVEEMYLAARVYPNPFAHQIVLDLPAPVAGREISATLLNATGQIVLSQTLTTAPFTLHTAQCPAGFYLLRITDAERSFTQALIKE
ncbi:MAG: T9SS type A sorting domain-containing protein [Bacteroidetes bacterium]|nr:T9SS type A sorting domain-containing protein [Bacteroidota bacterium]